MINHSLPVVLAGIAFVGILASLSSCTIMRLPVIWGYVTAAGVSRRRSVLLSVLFTCGIIAVYTLMGFALSVVSNLTGKLLRVSHYLYFTLGIVLLILGIIFAGLIPIKQGWFHNYCQTVIKRTTTNHSAFILGVMFAFLETPACPACGAALLVIGSLVVMKESWLYSGSVFISFAIGQSIPVLVLGFSASMFKYLISRAARIEKGMSFIAGNILIVLGLSLIALA
ncbi:MAG TPA: cytochrome c biogenesis protein CcdA [Syntrophales bacterium]|nr:cytochrome c biogenesis protein CcdA [Syntrophales bacterium]